MRKNKLFLFLLIFCLVLSAFAFSMPSLLKAAPSQITLKNKQMENLYYFDPLPSFASAGTVNELQAYVYEMSSVIEGEIDEVQTSNWFAILKDASGTVVISQALSGGKAFSLVAGASKDGKYFVVATDSLTAPTWSITKEIFIKYKVAVSLTDVKPCPGYTCRVEGTVTRGANMYPSSSINVSISHPYRKLAASQTSASKFSLVFPGTSYLGFCYLYIQDGYPAVSPDNDAIIYGFIPNYETVTWTLKELVPSAPLYNDEEENLSQSIVFYLEDSNGKPVIGKQSKMTVSMSWSAPQVKEISPGVYKVYGGRIKGSSVSFQVKDVISSNTVTKQLTKLSYFNPYITIDAKYSAPPYGSGPYTDNTLGRSVFDFLPATIGNSLEVYAGLLPVPGIQDPANTKFKLSDNYYIYKQFVKYGDSLEKHSTSEADENLFFVKASGGITVNISAIIWQRANQDSTPGWSTAPPDPYNACCVKTPSITYSIVSKGTPCSLQIVPESVEVGKQQNLTVGASDSSIVHIYVVDSNGYKVSDSMSVSYKGGTERRVLTDLWYNPLHIPGTNIPELPVSFSYDDNVDMTYSTGRIIFRNVAFNCVSTHPVFTNSVVVEIFSKEGEKYPPCGIYKDAVKVIPSIKKVSGEYQVISPSGTSKTLTSMAKQSVLITAQFDYAGAYVELTLNGKVLESYDVKYNYMKTSDGSYLISFTKPLPYDETYSPNKLNIAIRTFSPDLMKSEELELLIPVVRISKETNPPEIKVDSPEDGKITNTNRVLVKGSVKDDTEIREFLINGSPVELLPGGVFEYEVQLFEGENVIQLQATDIFGNVKKAILKAICDTIPPSFSFSVPQETTSERIIISGSTEKDVKIMFRDSEISNQNGIFSVEASLLEGKNYFFFSFTDPAGNKAKTTLEIVRKHVDVVVLEIGSPYMYVNSKLVEVDPGRNTKPVIENGRTLVPIRALIEALGGYISWDASERRVFINLGKDKIEMWIGKNKAKVNGVEKQIDPDNPNVVPKIINERTMLPLRFIVENLGATVEWDPVRKMVKITYIR